jgi:hypothetical protein
MRCCGDARYLTVVQYVLPVFTIFEVLEGPMHGNNDLEASNCKLRHHANTTFNTEICGGAMISVAQYVSLQYHSP